MEEIAQSFNAAKYQRAVFPNLDIVKFFMAFLVVEIHASPFGPPPLVQGVDCIATPLPLHRVGVPVLSRPGCHAIF